MPIKSMRMSVARMTKPSDCCVDSSTEIMEDSAGSLHMHAPKKVTFHEQDTAIIGSSRTEEVEDNVCFYTKDEIADFRKRDFEYMQVMITSVTTSLTGDDDNELVSLIGLLPEREQLQRLKQIREGRARVTEEQLSQEKTFFKTHTNLESFHLDPEAISDSYSSFSKSSAEAARVRGLLVSYHVENLWEDSKASRNKRPTHKHALVRTPGGINVFAGRLHRQRRLSASG